MGLFYNKKVGVHRGDKMKGSIEIPDKPEGDYKFNSDSMEWEAFTPQKELIDRLRDKINMLSDDDLAAYAPLIGAVESFAKSGRVGAIKSMIKGARLISSEHEPLRKALLNEPEFE